MKILVIGSGGREHALVWRLAQSPSVNQLYAMPGNPGTAPIARSVPASDYLSAARELHADLTVVGPEAPLVAGLVDRFRAHGLRIIGPTADAARLEGSKIYAKLFLQQRAIPTAVFRTVQNQTEARAALDYFGVPLVLKEDGLAAGKGVVVARDRTAAETALATLRYPLVVEEYLEGEEISFIVFTDGKSVVPFEPTQDHKPVCDGDTGPNTGGMGAYSDSRLLSEALTRQILDTIIYPTIEATAFTGFLYAGLMLTKSGPKVVEFNVRLGDPEAQPLMHRMDADLAAVLMGEGRLAWKSEPSVCVVLASAGYPGPIESGKPITGIEEAEAAGATVFHAGTRKGAQHLETSGGRVLGVTASGPDLAAAIDHAYLGVRKIHFDGAHYRTDIGRKGLRRYNKVVPGT